MRCTCHIVPADVLKRLSEDQTLPEAARRAAEVTARVDAEFRKLRDQAQKLLQVATLAGLNPNPPIPDPREQPARAVATPVYTCSHSQALPGTPISNPGGSGEGTVKRTYDETRALADFYKQVFKRNSIDDAGMALISSVHYGTNYNNAFWNGTQMTYGDGDNSIFIDFTRGNDVIGHELTHGVTQHTLQLAYANEPGGLNESLSDCFGSMFRQWQANQTAAAADWLIGKDIIGPAAAAKGITCLRDMADPAAKHCLAPQPTKYAQITPGMDPHYSSGPPNLAFCTAAKKAGGKSWDKVGQVWYHSMTAFGASPNLKMKDFAHRTRTVAGQLFPGDVALAAAVDGGWKLVGL